MTDSERIAELDTKLGKNWRQGNSAYWIGVAEGAYQSETKMNQATLERDKADQARRNASVAVVIAQERIAELESSLEEYQLRLAGALTALNGHRVDQSDPELALFLRACPTIAAAIRERRGREAAEAKLAETERNWSALRDGAMGAYAKTLGELQAKLAEVERERVALLDQVGRQAQEGRARALELERAQAAVAAAESREKALIRLLEQGTDLVDVAKEEKNGDMSVFAGWAALVRRSLAALAAGKEAP